MSKKRKSPFAGKVGSNVQNQKRAASSYGYLQLPRGVEMLSVDPNGKATFDIIPYEITDKNHLDRNEESEIAIEGSLWYKKPFKIHRNIGVENDTIVCPTTIGKKCPICEYRAKRVLEKADKAEIDSLKTSLRNLYIIIPKRMKGMEEVPYIWDMSQHLFQNLLNDEIEENSDYEIFPDLQDGLTLKVRFVPGSMKTPKPYPEASRIDFMERSDSYDETILEDVPNLDEILNILSYNEIHSKFYEEEAEEKDVIDDEEDDTHVKTRKKKSNTPKSKNDPDDYDNEDDEEDDNENTIDKLTWGNLEEMNQSKLEKLIEENEELEEIDPDDYDDDVSTLRKVIAKELGISVKEKSPKKETSSSKRTRKKVDLEEDDESEDDESVTRGRNKTSKKGKCPHGHKFGNDVNRYDDCDTCNVWEDCIEEAEK